MSQSWFAALSPEAKLEWILEQLATPLQQHCNLLVGQYQDVLDPAEDAQDLNVRTEKKFWTAYLAPDARNDFVYYSKAETLALLKRIASNALLDLVRERQREYALLTKVNHLRLIELDAPLQSDEEGGETFADIASSAVNIALEVEAMSRISEAMAVACKNARGPGKEMVAQYLLGERKREDLADYDDNYINVTTHRLYKEVRDYLAKE